MNLKIEYLPINALKAYEGNARKHTDEDVATIVESIKEYGFDDPIGIWGENNLIVEGHGRLLAAQMLKMDKVPCIRLDHLTDEQRRGYALAHNRTAELSGWDFGKLDAELKGIKKIDMTAVGFTSVMPKMEEPKRNIPAEYEQDDAFEEEQAPLSKEEMAAYKENADSYLLKKRVIITYLPQYEMQVMKMLGVEDGLKVVYDIEELLK